LFVYGEHAFFKTNCDIDLILFGLSLSFGAFSLIVFTDLTLQFVFEIHHKNRCNSIHLILILLHLLMFNKKSAFLFEECVIHVKPVIPWRLSLIIVKVKICYWHSLGMAMFFNKPSWVMHSQYKAFQVKGKGGLQI
jgi:hypothetical protein